MYIELKTHHPKAGATKALNIRTVFRWILGVLRDNAIAMEGSRTSDLQVPCTDPLAGTRKAFGYSSL